MNIDVMLSAEAIQQINYLNSSYKGLEWLAYAAYTAEKLTEDYVKLTVKGVFPLDLGSSVYTDTKETSQIQTDVFYPDCEIGGMHSHHTMSTGFSPTDEKELKDNYTNYVKGYLSIIVNYAMHNNAKFAYTVKTVTPAHTVQSRKWSMEEFKMVTTETTIPEKTVTTMKTIQCSVFSEYTHLYRDSTVAKWFEVRVEDLKKKALEKVVSRVVTAPATLECKYCRTTPYLKQGRYFCPTCYTFTETVKRDVAIKEASLSGVITGSKLTFAEIDTILYRLFKGVSSPGSFKQIITYPATKYTKSTIKLVDAIRCIKDVTKEPIIPPEVLEDILDDLYETAAVPITKKDDETCDRFLTHLYKLIDE